jgi:glycine/D-amino acid oxidase-like deaminating enzyme
MNARKEVDFIIVGQGLAGSVLAVELLRREKKVFVFDEPDKNYSSSVAAGLFNPITGRVMTKTWKADLLFPFLFNFYVNAEKNLGGHFFYPMPLYRPFKSVQEQNEWMGKSTDPGIQGYLKKILLQAEFGEHVHDTFGGLLLSQCGYIDTNLFIKLVSAALLKQESFSQEYLVENEVQIGDDFVCYRNLKARKIIFCNGNASYKSHFFSWLPFKPLKGETINVRIDREFKCIYNRGVYIVPTDKSGLYKVGATYETQNLTEAVTEVGRSELSEKLSELLKLTFEITTQNWGIRPSTADRKPFLGCHPQEKKVVIFNGLGTKGVSLAPYFANQLANWLLGQGEIDQEVDIGRFKFKK